MSSIRSLVYPPDGDAQMLNVRNLHIVQMFDVVNKVQR